jgi:hypothetical protein
MDIENEVNLSSRWSETFFLPHLNQFIFVPIYSRTDLYVLIYIFNYLTIRYIAFVVDNPRLVTTQFSVLITVICKDIMLLSCDLIGYENWVSQLIKMC